MCVYVCDAHFLQRPRSPISVRDHRSACAAWRSACTRALHALRHTSRMQYGTHPECSTAHIQNAIRHTSRMQYGTHPECNTAHIQNAIRHTSRTSRMQYGTHPEHPEHPECTDYCMCIEHAWPVCQDIRTFFFWGGGGGGMVNI